MCELTGLWGCTSQWRLLWGWLTDRFLPNAWEEFEILILFTKIKTKNNTLLLSSCVLLPFSNVLLSRSFTVPLFALLLVYLKGEFTQKSNLTIHPVPCSSVYLFRQCCCELPSSGGNSYRDIWLLSSMTELDDISLEVLKVTPQKTALSLSKNHDQITQK